MIYVLAVAMDVVTVVLDDASDDDYAYLELEGII